MPANEQVVLVHGLWMHGVLMGWMARRMARFGYTVHCYSYPSVRMSLVENARRLAAFCQALDARPVHLVGHSLGGLLIARMLDEPHRLEVGRVVLMGSPFVDSYAARRLCRMRIGCMAVGASVAEWLQGARPGTLACYAIGVIAGNRGVGLGVMMAPDLPAPHDGTVSVCETLVPGARDHIVLPVTHTQMVISRVVVRQVCEFLRRGHFARRVATCP
jgi:pimeloyl-ACP methyl ester carboxylesterase